MTFLTKACFATLLAASALSTPAFAQDDENKGPFTLSGGVDVVSDYRFRGISLSNEKVEVQPSLTLTHDSGFYVSAWGSTLPDSPLYGRFELDLIAGYSTEVAPGTTIDLNTTYYAYPGHDNGAGPANYVEFIGSVSHDIGPVSATALAAYAPSQKSLGSDDNVYLNLGLGFAVPNTPVTLNAGFSAPGREFAAAAADFLLTSFVDIEKGRDHIDDMRQRARAHGREIGVCATCHVVCRPSQSEAEDYYEHYAVTMADHASVDHYMGQKEKFSGSHEAEAYRLHRKRFAGGAGTYPLVGTPAHIASEMIRIHRAGFAGTTVSFVNFKNELPYFIEAVLPLLREAGLRETPQR